MEHVHVFPVKLSVMEHVLIRVLIYEIVAHAEIHVLQVRTASTESAYAQQA
jgi:hypothetical protein